jgi:alkanesulfonate monooxygenase SsuD/methylene tetrahydromethanopterin reductase-like flavin-dependent oxidoreductase (luciferase family)
MQDQDPKLTLADAEVIQPNPVIVGGGGKIPSMAKIAAMLAQTFMPMNHAKPQYKPKNLLSVDYDAKLSAAEAKRLKRQQRNIKNAS